MRAVDEQREGVEVTVADGTVSPGPVRTVGRRIGERWRARELLVQLVRKELKVRYRSSSLGFLWSMLTPALMTVVFTVLFTQVVRIPVDAFPAFFIAGYLLWQFFQNSCQGAIHSIVGNADLVKKVYFPREVLPLSHVLAQLIHLLLALLVISPFLIVTRGWGVVAHLPATLVAIALLTVFASGVAMWLAGVNVSFRDLQELFVVMYLVWFYATPVLYPLALVRAMMGSDHILLSLLKFNPMTWFVELFRIPMYGVVEVSPEWRAAEAAGLPTAGVDPVVSLAPTWPPVTTFGMAALFAVLTFVGGYVVFLRRARTFAKEV